MAKGSKKRKRDSEEEEGSRPASGTMSKKRKRVSAEGSKAEDPAAKWARTQLELSKAVNSVVMVLADTLLNETLNDEQKVSTFSKKVTPTTGPGLTSLKLKCNKCEVEQFYALRKPLVGPNENQMSRRVREAPFGLKDLKPRIQGLGIICPDCTVKDKVVRRWPDGYPRHPPEMNTEGQLVQGVKTMIEVLFSEKTLSHAMQPLLTNSTLVDKSKMQEATPEQIDTLQMFSKTVKAMSDERMRENDGLCRDPIKNKQMVADCTRVLVPCPYIPETENRTSRDPGSHDYESLRAGVQSVKNRPVEIYSRGESSFMGMLNFTFGGRPLPNHSVPPDEEYLYLATRHKASDSPLTANRKVLLDGPNVKDGYIKTIIVQIPYHYPMAPVQGGVAPECRQYVKQYVGAVRRFEDAYAELGDKSLAIEQMCRDVQNEAYQDLAAALSKSANIPTPLVEQVGMTQQDGNEVPSAEDNVFSSSLNTGTSLFVCGTPDSNKLREPNQDSPRSDELLKISSEPGQGQRDVSLALTSTPLCSPSPRPDQSSPADSTSETGSGQSGNDPTSLDQDAQNRNGGRFGDFLASKSLGAKTKEGVKAGVENSTQPLGKLTPIRKSSLTDAVDRLMRG